jgi:hypothetical protein
MSRSIKPALQRLGLAATAAGLLALLPTSSFAAPLSGVYGARAQSPVTQVEYRCRWSYGERRCTWLGDDAAPRVYGYRYGPYDYGYHARPRTPESYRPGSSRWWKSMERWGRTGNQ